MFVELSVSIVESMAWRFWSIVVGWSALTYIGIRLRLGVAEFSGLNVDEVSKVGIGLPIEPRASDP